MENRHLGCVWLWEESKKSEIGEREYGKREICEKSNVISLEK